MAKKKKWYDTWWGALWVLAAVEASPGRGVRTFMEMDEALKDMAVEDEAEVRETSKAGKEESGEDCPAGAVCGT
jgi:hypothetical protein